MTTKFRLVTRSDFDGLVCAVLLQELDKIEDILFVHPKDMQDGKIDIGPDDITTNLPYVPGCHLAFDHHESETTRLGGARYDNHIIDPAAPSAARVVYDHFGGLSVFPNVSTRMMAAVDQADSAQFSRSEILHPTGWVLLNFLMDARTGIGRFQNFRISNYELMMQLIDVCRTRSHDVDSILETPDIRARVELFHEQNALFQDQIQRCSRLHDDLIVLDLRDEKTIYTGNRFIAYALYPLCTISMHVLWGKQKQNTVFAIGKSIINRSSSLHIGNLALEYGGGGHANAGTCQVATERAEEILAELIERIKSHESNTQETGLLKTG